MVRAALGGIEYPITMLRIGILTLVALSSRLGAQIDRATAPSDSGEVAVLRAVLSYWKARPDDYVRQSSRLPLCPPSVECNAGSECVPDTLRVEFGAAAEDFLARQRQDISLSASTLAALGLRVATSMVGDSADPCGAPTTYLLSHVGMDTTRTRAVVVATVQRGRGPRPGCGSAVGASFLLRRAATGEWLMVGTLNSWRT